MSTDNDLYKFKNLFEDELQTISVPEISSRTEDDILSMIESKERKTVQQENKFYGMSVSSVAATFLVVLSLVFLPMLIENDGAELKLAMKNSQELEQKVKIRLSDLNLEPSVYMEIAKVKTEISNIDQQLIELYSREQAKPNSGEEIKLWNLRASKLHSILKAYNSQSDLYSI